MIRVWIVCVLVSVALVAEARLYSGGEIVTMHGEQPAYVEAVVSENGKIVFVGSKKEALVRYPEASLVDLEGKTMLPAFFDPHGHLLLTTLLEAYVDLNAPPIGDVDSIATLQAKLQAYIKEHDLKEGEWVIGMNYDDTGMKEQRHPTKEDLDAISTKHPIYIMHSSSHFGVANSLALKLAGIDAKIQDPKGGKFYRNKEGDLTGVMEEGPAYTQVMMKITPVAPQTAMKAIEKTLMKHYLAQGMTTVQECGGALPDFIKLLYAMGKAGRLKADVLAYVDPDNMKLLQDTKSKQGYDNHVKIGGLKVMMDGSIQGYTGYLSKPYFKIPERLNVEGAACKAKQKASLLLGGSSHMGQDTHQPSAKVSSKGFVSRPSYTQEELDKIIGDALEKKWHVMVHCNGDGAIDMLLQSVKKAKPKGDHRTTIVHSQTIREDQLDEVKALGMALTMFPSHIYYWGDRHAQKFLGPERTKRLNPMRSIIKRGIPYTIHHDTPVTPTSILDMISFAVNRTSLGGTVYGKDQAMSVYEALKAVTINAAYQHYEEQQKGTIEVGKEADFVILSGNPLKTDKKQLRSIKVQKTINDGEVVFEAS